MAKLEFATGEIIFSEGDVLNGIFVIEEGRVELHSKIDGYEVLVGKVGSGEMLGVIPAVKDLNQLCSAIACQPTRLSIIPVAEFKATLLSKLEKWTIRSVIVKHNTAKDLQGAKVAIIDEDPLLVSMLAHKFSHHGSEVVATMEGHVALDLIREHDPDVIVLAGFLPGFDGLQLLRNIKNDPEIRDVPVVMISERHSEEAIAAAFKSGAADYLTKPFIPNELVIRIGKLLQ